MQIGTVLENQDLESSLMNSTFYFLTIGDTQINNGAVEKTERKMCSSLFSVSSGMTTGRPLGNIQKNSGYTGKELNRELKTKTQI